MEEPDVHGRFATVVIGDYHDPKLKLPDIDKHAARVAAVLRDLGFGEDLREGGSSAAQVQEWLSRWRPSSRRLLLYWTGHAQDDGDDITLYCGDYHDDERPWAKISGRELGKLLARSSAMEIVVIIDACKGGVGVDVIAHAFKTKVQRLEFAVGREPGLAVLSSARAGEFARDGVFAAALDHILREGPPPPTDTYSGWTARDELITPNDLYDALRVHLHNKGAYQQPDFAQQRSVGGFFPFFTNPRHRPHRPDATVDTLRDRAFAESDLLEHFLVKFRGIDTLTADGWYYAPRTGPQSRITEWLSTSVGMLVVTGPPGSGKSALLGWLAAISSPHYRRHATDKTSHTSDDNLPAEGAVDAGIHAKQHTLQECVANLGAALELTPPIGGWQEPGPLVEQITALAADEGRTITILLDALDEAYPADQQRIAIDLLAALAAQPRVRVIVGTRPNREDPDHRTTPDGHWTADGPLIRALTTAPDRVLRLDTDPGSAHAITTYLTNRLLDPTTTSPYRGNPQLAAATAATIAEHSDGIFLFARLIARALINRDTPLDLTDPETLTLFNGGVAQAFETDLTNYGPDRDRVYDLLAPLAWAEGSGLPRRDIWLTLANALTRPGITYTDQDIAWVLEHAGAHIIESGEDGQTVYRLYHQAFNDYFQRNINHTWVQATITHALLDLTYPT
ncbi:caspase family protein [Nocardia gipuzkoensis]|uniref:caspase family protein n=1 Tax=Nocardia gipuzkoensis TaxID=2749991 RepID=UPI0015EF3A5A|nr:caspase family protein [Nocardia gipuzkoensis]